jgi:Methyltransferase domain
LPDLSENAVYWNTGFHWRSRGDEWSRWWGSPAAEWNATIFPRVSEFLPVQRLVEIAPGFGRWTAFLRRHCDELIGVDLSARCVKACRRRFWRHPRRMRFYVNDGKSLAAVGVRAADFVFSFDSLVHVEQDVMASYIGELARTLADDGVAFLHHSHMGAYPASEVGERVPHWRSASVSADSVADTAAAVGLRCFKQELIRWGDDHEFLNDALTWIARPGSRYDREPTRIVNKSFMDEARRALVDTAN